MMNKSEVNKLIKRCHKCGTSLSQLRASKRAGCYVCYDTFEEEINRMTGDGFTASEGNRPEGEETIMLKNRLKKALFAENYELAARLRDELAGIGGDELPR
ncbi:MAG: UvrB/UvrC motif-containing protein [Spirochaetales bacterium]|nr:UvrB/UvrC motif-containing protein [Spirochaetales bacterium]